MCLLKQLCASSHGSRGRKIKGPGQRGKFVSKIWMLNIIRWKYTPSPTMIVRSAPRASWGTILETWNAWHALSASNWSLLCNNSNFRLIGPANMFKKHSNAPKISSVKNFSSPLHNVQHASESQTNKSLCNNPTSQWNPFIPAKKKFPYIFTSP